MKCVDLFAGCGGLSCGLSNAGIDVIAAFDSWNYAVHCYKNNFEHPVFLQDLSNVKQSIKKINKFDVGLDIIAGGPPCQEFSHAGLRIEGERAALTECFAKIVSGISPNYFIMENVDRAYKSDSYKKARKIFKDSGYGLNERVLDASKCGAPQKRRRFFCIGAIGEEDGFLDEIINNNLDEISMTVRDYFKQINKSIKFKYYYRHPRNYSRRGIFSIDEPAPTIRGVNRPVPGGYPGHSGDPAPVTEKIRALTTHERALLQTFPSSFSFEGTKTDMEQVIGNAVPVKQAEFVGNCLVEFDNISYQPLKAQTV